MREGESVNMSDETEQKQGDVSAIITRTNKRNRDDGGGEGVGSQINPLYR